jgi:hypothetical protein
MRVDGHEFVGLGRPSRRTRGTFCGQTALSRRMCASTCRCCASRELSWTRIRRCSVLGARCSVLGARCSVLGARELVRRRAGRRQVLVDRVAGVGSPSRPTRFRMATLGISAERLKFVFKAREAE